MWTDLNISFTCNQSRFNAAHKLKRSADYCTDGILHSRLKMNSLPSANLFAKQLRLGISKFNFCVITFNFICFVFFLINCISFCVVGVQLCYKRLASQSAKDIIVPAMPATSFQPQPYDVNNVVFLLHNITWK